MKSHPVYNTLKALETGTESRGLKVGKSTIDRAIRGETTLNLDYIEVIAACYGLASWQLLVPNIAPDNPPTLREMSKSEESLYRRLQELAKQIAIAS